MQSWAASALSVTLWASPIGSVESSRHTATFKKTIQKGAQKREISPFCAPFLYFK